MLIGLWSWLLADRTKVMVITDPGDCFQVLLSTFVLHHFRQAVYWESNASELVVGTLKSCILSCSDQGGNMEI